MPTTFKAIGPLGRVLKKVPVSRRKLRKYSWLPDVLRLDGSIVGRIIGPVLTVTIFAAAVATASEVYHYHLNLTNNVTPLLSVVVGLILVFRNGTSYDRYYEARKDFASLTATIRNLSRLLWVHVMLPTEAQLAASSRREEPSNATLTNSIHGSTSKQRDSLDPTISNPRTVAEAKVTDDKIRAIKLLLSFVYSVVHHLRDEPGTDYDDYVGVLPPGFKYSAVDLGLGKNTLLHRYATYAAIDSGRLGQHRLPSFRKHKHRPSSPEVQTASPTTPLVGGDHATVEFRPKSMPASLPLPLVIAHEISRLLYKFKMKRYIEPLGPGGYQGMNLLLSNMITDMTAMERIATTPIPISYGIHLKQCVTLYLFVLPFVLINDMSWKTIPIVTLVAFTLMGIEGIANEIEMPFGKDATDLPLEQYCVALRSEVEYMIERLPEGPEEDLDPFDED